MTYEVVMRNQTAAEKSPIAGNGTKGVSAGGNGEAVNSDGLKGIMAVKSAIAPFVDKIYSHRVNTVSLRTGSTEQQQRISTIYSIAKQAGSIAMSTAMGAVMGGGAPGAIIGLLTSITTTALSYSQKASDLRMQRDLENQGMIYANIRAGGSIASYSSSRAKKQ